MTAKETRERMKAQPFSPVPNVTPELRIASALEYTAYYLGEIESHLSKLAAHAEPSLLNLAKVSEKLGAIAHALPSLQGKK